MSPPAVFQSPVFASEAAPASTPPPRPYVRYQLSTVRWLAANYADYSLQECAVQLGLPWRKVLYLCRPHGIRKRAPNKAPDPRTLYPPTPLAMAA